MLMRKDVKIRWLQRGLLGGLLAVSAVGGELIPNKDCLECHGDKELVKTNAAGRAVSLYVDAAKLAASVHQTNLCVGCHSDLTAKHPDDNVAAKPVTCGACHREHSQSYGASVHGQAQRAGQLEAATCADCHGTHDVVPANSPASPLHWSRLTATCGECHPQVARDVEQSVHGRAIAQGRREAATCTDCHSEHKILNLKADSPVKLAEEVCGRCHASERINTKFRMPNDRVKTFFESYHGLAAQFGSMRAANCASCHGVHLILPSSDPRSMIHPSHLVQTCGQCHPGASTNFVAGKVHMNGAAGKDLGTRVNRWVRRAYIGVILVVIGVLGLHNLLLWARKLRAAYRLPGRTLLRMSRGQRVQHFLLLTSFIILAISGFALKFPESWLGWLLGSEETLRRWIHRVAALVLLGVGGYHLLYVWFTTEGRRLWRDLLPRPQDARDAALQCRYLLGRPGPKPRFGRFGYIEKSEYWAVVWGTIVMGITGFMIWWKIDVTLFVPRWVVEVAVTIHYYEAILACLAIAVWHFYHVIFDPDVYPINWAWWDGKVSAHWYAEEHGLDVPVAPLVPPPAVPPKAEQEPHAPVSS